MLEYRYMYDNIYTKEFLEFARHDYLKHEKLTITTVENGLVLPLKKSEPGGPLMGYGGVLDAKGNYVRESAQIGKGDTKDRFNGKYDYDKGDECFYNENVIYIGAFPPHWGHFLVDMVYRLWFCLEDKGKERIVYCSDGTKINGVFLEFFELLQIDKDRLFRIEKPSRFRQVIIPEPAYMACDYYSLEYRNTFKTLIHNMPDMNIEPYEKIYLSRGHFQEAHSKEVGEKNIELNFQKNGYHILYMEELSLKEQVFYISHCKKVAALSGTLCHNILFADKETELIILNKTHIINTHQVLINQMIGNKVTYIDVYKKPFHHFPVSYGGGPFLLDSRELIPYFKQENMRYYSETKLTMIANRVIYVKMCLGIIIYKIYEKMYYKLCRHKVIIGILRKIRIAVKR